MVCNCLKKAFVPQKAVVITGTVRDNIMMGKAWNPTLYRSSLEIADMDTDLEELPDGDGTVVGERGVTLSGGQQQRLAIARAMYAEPDFLVLDDPLAAVDPVVASTIFGKLQAWWEATRQSGHPATVVMALNQIHLLPSFQRIVFLDRPGHVGECSDYASLLEHNGTFNDLIAMYSHNNEKSIDEVEGEKEKEVAALALLADTKSSSQTQAKAEKALAKGKSDRQSTQHELVSGDFLQDGKVKANTYAQFFGAMGVKNLSLCILSGLSSYAAMLFGDFCLATWLADEEGLSDQDKKTKY